MARDTASVLTSVNTFVKSYNDISQNLRDAAAYNATTKTGAILNGEASVRTIQNQIRNVLTAPVAGGASAFTLLSHVGVTMQKDGLLAVDSTKLLPDCSPLRARAAIAWWRIQVRPAKPPQAHTA